MKSTRIEARPTWYRGTLMRSRLEASAAGLLDELNVPWVYEPCCFASGPEQYLPDFQLFPDEQSKIFLEIKPEGLCLDWPPEPRSPLAVALRRMEVIHDTYPDALLFVWLPDLDCECGGYTIEKLTTHDHHWTKSGGARRGFEQLVEHAAGLHAGAST